MRLNDWPVGNVSNKDWSADVQEDQQNPQKRSLHPVTFCYTPLYPRHTMFLPPLHPVILPFHTAKSPIYPDTPRYTLLHPCYTPSGVPHPNLCVLVLLSSSSSPEYYGFYGPQIGWTCRVHLVKFPILISRTFQGTICSCWRGDPTVGVVLLMDIEAL